MRCVEKREWVSVVRAVVVGLASSFLLLVIGNFLAMKSPHPDKLLSILAYVALTAGAAVCGLTQSGGRGSWKLPAITGGVYALVLLLISLIAGGASNLPMRALVFLLEGVVVLLVSHFLSLGSNVYTGRGKKAAYRYLERR